MKRSLPSCFEREWNPKFATFAKKDEFGRVYVIEKEFY